MRKTSLIILLFLSLRVCAQQGYWQQSVNYLIDVTLNDKDKTIEGFEKLTYINHSPDTLRFIWFHLWPNAYKNDRTAFSEQLLRNGNTQFYFSGKEQKGYINRLDFKVNGTTAKTEDHPEHIDIVKLILPAPLAPGAQAIITTPFHVKLPFNFSRGGYDGNTFQITQWYPKPAVYDRNGWHPMPYLDQGEFYSEFGSFDVRITLPKDYVVAATGELQNEDEKQWLLQRKFYKEPAPVKISKPVPGQKKTAQPKAPAAPVELKTLRYLQDRVHDFAWFANKHFIVETDSCHLINKTVTVSSYYTAPQAKHWKDAVGYAKQALRFYSDQLAEYPYNTASVVQGPPSFGGGMEYPTITILSPQQSDRELDLTIAHELGHNWFYGILASNERKYPWMDEGMNTFYENKYGFQKYGYTSKVEEIGLINREKRRTDQPINTPSDSLNYINYGLIAYNKTANWMRYLESQLGKETFRERMQAYYESWSFKHPQPGDFEAIMARTLGKRTQAVFGLLDSTGVLPNEVLKGSKVITTLQPSGIKNYLEHPVKDLTIISPAIGFNAYDKFMIGALVTNYKLPVNKFQYFLSGLYGTGSNRLNGIGKLNYNFYPKKVFRMGQVFVNGSSFSMNEYRDSADRKMYTAFEKLVPGIKLVFREKSALSTIRKYIQWKSFLINEQYIDYRRGQVINGVDTSVVTYYDKKKKDYSIHQLQFSFENTRSLYPYAFHLVVEKGNDFYRPAFDLNYFFNYARGGGFSLRFFAGKFIYIGEKTLSKQFATDRYHLNLTGANGYEDYTYSNYFVGRNKFEGFASQQIAIRDGGFKVRTDLLADKVGKSDDWLMAINLNTTVPDHLNPLSALPIKIPLRLFADIGTNAEGWKRTGESDRFLFDAGLHIPLMEGMFNLYIPLLYSKIYRDYFKSTIPENRFIKTMSFTINFNIQRVKQLNYEAEF